MVRELPSILDGSAEKKAQPQDESKATKAPKVPLVEVFYDRYISRIKREWILVDICFRQGKWHNNYSFDHSIY